MADISFSLRHPLGDAPALVKALLACGVAYPVAYVIANDLVAATIYDGYDPIDQAISELSATEAPSRAFLAAMLPLFSLLVIAFGIGVRRVAAGNRPLRITGGILVAQGLLFPLWLLFPMTSREGSVDGALAANDVGHFVLGAVAIALILAELGFSAAGLGKGFRIFAITMGAAVLVCGALTGVLSSDLAQGGSTPWMGFVERISYGAWLLWMATLALVMLRRMRVPVPPPLPNPRGDHAALHGA